ncbi:hypothetical protein PT2222_50134 [Paraburkholderia tropica]
MDWPGWRGRRRASERAEGRSAECAARARTTAPRNGRGGGQTARIGGDWRISIDEAKKWTKNRLKVNRKDVSS